MTRKQFDEAVWELIAPHASEFDSYQTEHSFDRKIINGQPASQARCKWNVWAFRVNKYCDTCYGDGSTPEETLDELAKQLAAEFPSRQVPTDAEQYAAAAGGDA